MAPAISAVRDQGEMFTTIIDGVKHERYRCTIDELGRPCGHVINKTEKKKSSTKSTKATKSTKSSESPEDLLKKRIKSHRRLHNRKSTYRMEAKKFAKAIHCVDRVKLSCEAKLNSLRAIESHHRRCHGYRADQGSKNDLFARYGLSSESRRIYDALLMVLFTDNASI